MPRRRIGDEYIGFDAGYCAFYAFAPWGQQQEPDGAEYIHVIHDEPRHPDALSAILVTGVHFGGITGPKASTGLNELAIEQLGNRFGQRTGF
eukprot:1336340-Prymnesium_polylepis.1